MPKILNEQYRNFIDKGLIDILDYDDLKEALNNVNGIYGDYIEEGRALLIALYYTGARPVELLGMKAEQIQKKDSYVTIELQAAKRGLNRTIFLPYRFKAVKELYDFAMKIMPSMYLFYHYRSKRIRLIKTKSGEYKEYHVITDKLYYHVKKWFKDVPDSGMSICPYFLRHNRFSQLSEQGLTPQELQQLKGAKTSDSVQSYLHLSSRTARKIAKHIR